VVGLTATLKPVPDKRGLYAPNAVRNAPSRKVLSFAAKA